MSHLAHANWGQTYFPPDLDEYKDLTCANSYCLHGKEIDIFVLQSSRVEPEIISSKHCGYFKNAYGCLFDSLHSLNITLKSILLTVNKIRF